MDKKITIYEGIIPENYIVELPVGLRATAIVNHFQVALLCIVHTLKN